MLLRPAVSQDPEQPSIELDQESAYQDALRAAVAAGGGRQGVEAASAEFATSADFVQSLVDTPLGQRLDELADGVDALEAMGEVSWSEIANAIEDVFGSSAADVVDGDPYKETVRRLRDSLIAIKVLQQLHSRPIERLTRQLRTAALIADVAAGNTPGETARRRRRSLRLPVELELKSRLSTRDAQQELDKQRQKLLDDRRKRVDELLAEHEALRGAVAELAGLESIHFRATEIVASDHTTVPDVTVLTNAVSSAATYTQVLRAQHLKGQLAREGEEGGEPDERAGALQISTPYAELAQTLVAAPDVVLSARAGFTPVALAELGFVLKPTAADRLSQSTQTVLKQRGIDLGTTPLDKITQRLQADLATTVGELELVAGHPEKRSFGSATR